MKLKASLLGLSILVAANTYAAAQESTDYVDLLLLLSGYGEEDFSRDSEPYSENIWFKFLFQNESEQAITGIEFTARFYDGFGDLVHETEPLKLNETIAVGEGSSPLSNYFYYENNEFISDEPFDKLVGGVRNDTIAVETRVARVVLEDGQVVEFPNSVYLKESTDSTRMEEDAERAREESPYQEEPIFTFEGEGFLQTETFQVTTPVWRLVLNAEGDGIASILVYNSSNNVVKSIITTEEDVIELGDSSVIPKFEDMQGAGDYHLEINAEGMSFTVFVIEAKTQ